MDAAATAIAYRRYIAYLAAADRHNNSRSGMSFVRAADLTPFQLTELRLQEVKNIRLVELNRFYALVESARLPPAHVVRGELERNIRCTFEFRDNASAVYRAGDWIEEWDVHCFTLAESIALGFRRDEPIHIVNTIREVARLVARDPDHRYTLESIEQFVPASERDARAMFDDMPRLFGNGTSRPVPARLHNAATRIQRAVRRRQAIRKRVANTIATYGLRFVLRPDRENVVRTVLADLLPGEAELESAVERYAG